MATKKKPITKQVKKPITTRKKKPAKSAVISGSSRIKPYRKLFSKRLGIFAAIIAVIGIGGLAYSFAATPNQIVEAETFTFDRNQSDIVKPGNTIATVWFGTEGSKVVNFEHKTTKLSVNASAGLCDGAPQMEVKVDGIQVMQTVVTSTSMATYSTDTSIAPGEHIITVGFLNDFYKPNVCDRNLFIDNFVLTGETVLDPSSSTDGVIINSVAATKLTYGTAGYTTPTGGVITRTGPEAQSTFTLVSATDTIVANVYAQACEGAPEMQLKIDDAVVLTGKVDGTSGKDYTVKKSLAAGTHTIKVGMTNDYKSTKCDRNLRLNKFDFRGKQIVKPTPVPPTKTPVPPTHTPVSTKRPPLKWAPAVSDTGYEKIYLSTASEVIDLPKGKDFELVMPKTPKGVTTIKNGRNIKIIGGEFSSANTDKDVALYLGGGTTGTIHLEGILIDSSKSAIGDGISGSSEGPIQVENVRIVNINGGQKSTRHGDIFQVWGSRNPNTNLTVRIDRLTGTTSGQGFFMRPDKDVEYEMVKDAATGKMVRKMVKDPATGKENPVIKGIYTKYNRGLDISNVDLYYNNLDLDPRGLEAGGDLLFVSDTSADPVNCRTADKITLSNVYIGRYLKGGNLGTSAYPGPADKPCAGKLGTDARGAQTLSWATSGLISSDGKGKTAVSGVVTAGAPPTGEFVPAGTAGIGYQSPGYIGQ